jgi:hypothetical protein
VAENTAVAHIAQALHNEHVKVSLHGIRALLVGKTICDSQKEQSPGANQT